MPAKGLMSSALSPPRAWMTLSFCFPIRSKLNEGEEVEGWMQIATTTNSIRFFRDIATGSCKTTELIFVSKAAKLLSKKTHKYMYLHAWVYSAEPLSTFDNDQGTKCSGCCEAHATLGCRTLKTLVHPSTHFLTKTFTLKTLVHPSTRPIS